MSPSNSLCGPATDIVVPCEYSASGYSGGVVADAPLAELVSCGEEPCSESCGSFNATSILYTGGLM